MCNNEGKGTYSVFLFIEHEGGDGLSLVGTRPSLSTNMDSSMANAEVIGGSQNGVEGRRHLMRVVMGV